VKEKNSMNEGIRMGQGREIISIPRQAWEQGLVQRKKQIAARIAFMTEDHQRVRNFVVKEIPNQRKPLSPEFINRELNMPFGGVFINFGI
jgi:hypothetical protein